MIKVANESCPNAAGRNYSGTMQFDISGHVTNYKSYELANTMGRGAAFIWDNCCRGLAAHEVPTAAALGANPYGKLQGLETWNLNGTHFTWNQMLETYPGIAPEGMQWWGGPGAAGGVWNGWVPDYLNNAGYTGPGAQWGAPFAPGYPGSTLDGSGVWIDPDNNLFGGINDCKIDGWHRWVNILEIYRYLRGNNTKKNYMVGYQQIGGEKNNVNPWSLRFNDISGVPHICDPAFGAAGPCDLYRRGVVVLAPVVQRIWGKRDC